MDITGVMRRWAWDSEGRRPRLLTLPVMTLLVFITVPACADMAGPLPSTEQRPYTTPAPAVSATPAGPRVTVTPSAIATPPGPRGPASSPLSGSPLPDDRVEEILDLFMERPPDGFRLQRALNEIVTVHDTRFIAPLIELIRAGPMQLVDLRQSHLRALQSLAGISGWQSWRRWIEWYGGTSLQPPPGFTAWKGRLLAPLDPRYAEFFQDDVSVDVRPALIIWSGVGVDGVAPLDDPPVVAGDSPAASYLDPGEPVLGVEVNGEARAYPLRIMDVHELANDTLGGLPVTVTHCPLCGASIAYVARGPGGDIYTLSSSGLLVESNNLVYDRQTGSLWQQFTGRPVVGPLVEAARGTHGPWLEPIPVVTSTWEDWRRMHPDTTVLDMDTGRAAGYAVGYPYLEYYISGDTDYPVSRRDLALLTKTWVYGIEINGAAVAYPVDLLLRADVVNDTVGGSRVTLVATGRMIQVEGISPMWGEVSYRAGGAIRAYESPPGINFSPGPFPGVVLDQDGGTWVVTEAALRGPDGVVAPRITGLMSYWFAWRTFHPHTSVHGNGYVSTTSGER